jgi:hypothetical protein
VWALAQKYFDGSIANVPVTLAIHALGSNQVELRFNTLRGFHYKLQSTPDLDQTFADEPGGFVQAFDAVGVQTNTPTGSNGFYRIQKSLVP